MTQFLSAGEGSTLIFKHTASTLTSPPFLYSRAQPFINYRHGLGHECCLFRHSFVSACDVTLRACQSTQTSASSGTHCVMKIGQCKVFNRYTQLCRKRILSRFLIFFSQVPTFSYRAWQIGLRNQKFGPYVFYFSQIGIGTVCWL